MSPFRVGDRVRYRGSEGVVTAVPASGYVAARFEGRAHGPDTFHLSCHPDALELLSRASYSVPEEARPLSTGAMAGGARG